MRRLRYLLYILLVIPVLMVSHACRKEPAEDKVRKVISNVQRSAEEKKIMSVLENISRTYQDPQGNDYDGIKGLLAFYFFRHQKMAVFIPNIDITISGPSARAVFQAVLTGKGTGEATTSAVLPESLGAYNFEVQFRKEEDAWKVTSAKWERVGEGAGQ